MSNPFSLSCDATQAGRAQTAKRMKSEEELSSNGEGITAPKRSKTAENACEAKHFSLPPSLAPSAVSTFQSAASSRLERLSSLGYSPKDALASTMHSIRRTATSKVTQRDWRQAQATWPHLPQRALGAAYVIRNELSHLRLQGYSLTEAVNLLSIRIGAPIDLAELPLPPLNIEIVNTGSLLSTLPHITPPNASTTLEHANFLSNNNLPTTPLDPSKNLLKRANDAHNAQTSNVPSRSSRSERRNTRFSSRNSALARATLINFEPSLHGINEEENSADRHESALDAMEDLDSPARIKRNSQDIIPHPHDLHLSLAPNAKRSRLLEQ